MNGLLLIDKPGGLTSHDVVARVRRITGESSVGHMGTLDPMATGLLPLLLGKWTRLAQYFGPLAKSYTGTIRFGYATDTYDAEGVPAAALVRPSFTADEVRAWAADALGTADQMPPPFSAKKVQGKAAYTLAREGKAPRLKPVPITIYAFEVGEPVLQPDGTVDVTFALTLSSGGYVRAVAHALGERAGCGAHLSVLRRCAAGPFTVDHALSLEALESFAAAETLEQACVPTTRVLEHLPAVRCGAETLTRMHNGAQVCLPEFSNAPIIRVFDRAGELAGIARRLAGVLFQPVTNL